MSEIAKRIAGVFLDRDGTIIEDVSYINDPADVKFLDGAIAGLKLLSDAGFALIVVSNQSGLARGLITEEQFQAVHQRFIDLLVENDIILTDCLYCPFYNDAVVEKYRLDSPDRKPAPGMIIKAAKRHNIYLPHSFMIGDKDDDIRAGQSAGVRTIKITKQDGENSDIKPDFFAANLMEAAKIIINCEGFRKNG